MWASYSTKISNEIQVVKKQNDNGSTNSTSDTHRDVKDPITESKVPRGWRIGFTITLGFPFLVHLKNLYQFIDGDYQNFCPNLYSFTEARQQ